MRNTPAVISGSLSPLAERLGVECIAMHYKTASLAHRVKTSRHLSFVKESGTDSWRNYLESNGYMSVGWTRVDIHGELLRDRLISMARLKLSGSPLYSDHLAGPEEDSLVRLFIDTVSEHQANPNQDLGTMFYEKIDNLVPPGGSRWENMTRSMFMDGFKAAIPTLTQFNPEEISSPVGPAQIEEIEKNISANQAVREESASSGSSSGDELSNMISSIFEQYSDIGSFLLSPFLSVLSLLPNELGTWAKEMHELWSTGDEETKAKVKDSVDNVTQEVAPRTQKQETSRATETPETPEQAAARRQAYMDRERQRNANPSARDIFVPRDMPEDGAPPTDGVAAAQPEEMVQEEAPAHMAQAQPVETQPQPQVQPQPQPMQMAQTNYAPQVSPSTPTPSTQNAPTLLAGNIPGGSTTPTSLAPNFNTNTSQPSQHNKFAPETPKTHQPGFSPSLA